MIVKSHPFRFTLYTIIRHNITRFSLVPEIISPELAICTNWVPAPSVKLQIRIRKMNINSKKKTNLPLAANLQSRKVVGRTEPVGGERT
jgi:hypothetical protein